MSNRVVITGIGAVTPVGSGKKAYWEGLTSGTSGIGRITLFDPEAFDVKIAGEVKNFEPGDYMDRKESRRMDRFSQFAVAAAFQAIEDAKLSINEQNAERVGVLIGSGIGGLQSLEDQIRVLIEKGPNRVSPFLIPMMIADMATGNVSILTGAKGPGSTVVTACATGAHALGDSLEILRRGDADVMIAGGSEAAVTPVSVAGFGNMKAMTNKFNDNPLVASRPFEARPRWVRYRRGRGRCHSGNARTRRKARRVHLLRTYRLRHDQRRLPHHTTHPRRRRRGAGDATCSK